MNLELSNRLLKLRKDHNLSKSELAERLGVTKQDILAWENGESSPNTEHLILLSNVYNVSVDELLGLDGNTNAPKVNLTKPDEYARVVYPKDSLTEEIYPNNVTLPPKTYQQTNPIVPTIPKGSKSKKKRVFVPTPTNNRFIKAFEKLMKRFKISYKGLYTFPCYAIGIALACVFGNYLHHGEYLAGASILSIPLYYSFISAIQHRNANRFAYPILAIMLMLISMFLTKSDASALWLATIPFYYWFINKDK